MSPMRGPDNQKDDLLPTTMQALSFLSRLPISDKWFRAGHQPVADTAEAFPLAGVIIALPASLCLLLATTIHLSPLVAALFAVTALIIVTGALHEDGLADVADGFYGGSTMDRRLEIMKDSRIGTYGALALIISFALRVALIVTIIEHAGPVYAALAIIGTEAASRSALVWFWHSTPNVRPGGTAAQAGTPDHTAYQWALGLGLAISVVTFLPAAGFFGFLIALAICAAAMALFSGLCREKIGGQTGDTLGAAQQIAVMSLLLGLAMAL